jgi:hypothetical protein
MTSRSAVSTIRQPMDAKSLARSCVTEAIAKIYPGGPSDLSLLSPRCSLVHWFRAPTLPSMVTPTALEIRYLSKVCSQWTLMIPQDYETKTPTLLNRRRAAELFRSCSASSPRIKTHSCPPKSWSTAFARIADFARADNHSPCRIFEPRLKTVRLQPNPVESG